MIYSIVCIYNLTQQYLINIQVNVQYEQNCPLDQYRLTLIFNHRQMASSKIFQQCRTTLATLFHQAQVDEAHSIEHALKVVDNSIKALAQCPKKLSYEIQEDIQLACLLHDADDRKLFPLNKNYENARKILQQAKYPSRRIDLIVEMIDAVSFSENGDSIDSKRPQWFYYPRYSDRIQAMGVINLERAYIYAQKVKNPVFTAQTPKPKTLQQVKQICGNRNEQYIKRGGTSQSIVDHIFDKLLHIHLPSQIKNPFFLDKFQASWLQLAQFVIQHAKNDYSEVESAILAIQKKKQ